MLVGVHQAAPNAKVITIGYPAVLPDDASTCNRLALSEVGATTHADVDWLRDDVLKKLNTTIQKVSDFFGDRYVDIYSSNVGHDACQPADEKWVKGVCGDAADYWPTKINAVLDCAAGNKRATLVHPNAAGHANTANLVERAIRIALLDKLTAPPAHPGAPEPARNPAPWHRTGPGQEECLWPGPPVVVHSHS